MKKYNLLVFDWDGTLVDSGKLVIEAALRCAADFGCTLPDQVQQYFGLDLLTIHRRLFAQVKYSDFYERFHQYCNEEKLADYFFPGALATLRYLKAQKFTLAIATNKPRAKLDLALQIADIKDFFAATRCPDDGMPKPHPDMLLSLLDELQYSPQEVLMIGDTTFDMEFAQNATVDALAVCYGHHKKEQLASFAPIGFLEDIQELQKIL